MKRTFAASLFLWVLVFAACSSFAQPTSAAIPILAPTGIPILETTVAPTSTLFLPAETPAVVAELTPEGQPASEWDGIPVMPGAIAGEGDAEGYVFTIKATPQHVQEYYQLELGKLGWQPFATGDGDSSSMLIFMNDGSATLTVSIVAKGEEVLVLLVK